MDAFFFIQQEKVNMVGIQKLVQALYTLNSPWQKNK